MPYPGTISLFVKPWATRSVAEMAQFAASLGVDGVELPVRDGLTVNPGNASTVLGSAASVFADHGLRITSVAGPVDEALVAACAKARVPLLRTMASVENGEGYLAAERRWRTLYENAAGFLRDHGVRLVVQHHDGPFVNNASGLRSLLEGLPPEQFGAVWDPGHATLCGEPPRHVVDILGERLAMVNLKSAGWFVESRGAHGRAIWRSRWVSAREGMTDFAEVFALLRERAWHGPLLHFAEYSDPLKVETLTRGDLAYWRLLMEEEYV